MISLGLMKTVPARLHRVCAASPGDMINISWDPLPCLLQNGADITGYIIRYSPTSGGEARNVSSAQMTCGQESGGPYRCLIAGSLLFIPTQIYAFQVAAINSYGNGPFSDPVNASLSSNGTILILYKHVLCHGLSV